MSSISSVGSVITSNNQRNKKAWPRGKTEILKGNLALRCCAVPTDVKFEYMKILAEQSSPLNKMQRVNSSNSSITNYFDSSANKRERINQALEISLVLNKINEELKNEDNLTLGIKFG
ncbi:1479_t:CDS:2 [Entrophospora sp. SA101]|nr:1479_t:CDS:2 [Entrophospora sp. SA101]